MHRVAKKSVSVRAGNGMIAGAGIFFTAGFLGTAAVGVGFVGGFAKGDCVVLVVGGFAMGAGDAGFVAAR